MKRNYAVYKENGNPWTIQELSKVMSIAYESNIIKENTSNVLKNKYIFDDGSKNSFMYPWSSQTQAKNFTNCIKITYEEFTNPKLKTYKIK